MQRQTTRHRIRVRNNDRTPIQMLDPDTGLAGPRVPAVIALPCPAGHALAEAYCFEADPGFGSTERARGVCGARVAAWKTGA